MNTNNKIKHIYKNVTTQELEERKQQVLSSIPRFDDLMRGTLITRSIKCGKPNCRCATGEGHNSLYLSSFHRGYTFLDYVPTSYETYMQRGITDFDKTTALLAELSEINLELFRRREIGGVSH
jgi:hypothetical protein